MHATHRLLPTMGCALLAVLACAGCGGGGASTPAAAPGAADAPAGRPPSPGAGGGDASEGSGSGSATRPVLGEFSVEGEGEAHLSCFVDWSAAPRPLYALTVASEAIATVRLAPMVWDAGGGSATGGGLAGAGDDADLLDDLDLPDDPDLPGPPTPPADALVLRRVIRDAAGAIVPPLAGDPGATPLQPGTYLIDLDGDDRVEAGTYMLWIAIAPPPAGGA